MSQDITASLLPSSRVDFFALDEGTAGTARKLGEDWRFARVDVQVTEGGIEAAIAAYGESGSPEMIIIETNDISDNFIAQLGELAGVCSEGTDAVIIGPMNDVHLYRSLVGMGVRDYLVRPVSEDDLVNVIAKALVDKRGLSGARLVAVTGTKGGVGTTTVAQLLAASIADGLKQKTILMDAAGSSGSLGIAYALEPAAPFAEAVRLGAAGTEDDMKRIVQHASENLSLLVCGGEPILADSPGADEVETLVDRIMQKYPFVVMDLSGASPAVQKRMISRAAHIILVSTPLLPALRNCRTLLNEVRHLRSGADDMDIVINMTGMASGEEVSEKDIKLALDFDPRTRIAFAPKVFNGSEATGKPAAVNKAAGDVMKMILQLAVRAAGVEPEEGEDGKKDSGKGGFLKMLGKKK